MTETANKRKAPAEVQLDEGRDNHLAAGVAQKTTETSVSSRTDSRRWESFDVWLQRYERATGRDDFRPTIVGGPRFYRGGGL